MYLNYKGTHYPCQCRPGDTMVYHGLPETFPAPIDAPVDLCRDDGFILRTDNPADYLRQTFSGGVLTLTNAPEPEPGPEPPLPGPSMEERVSTLEKDNALLKAQNEMQAQQQTFLEDCLLEMGNIVYA